jgi:hypothetical protein
MIDRLGQSGSLNPPAMVRESESTVELVARAKTLLSEIDDHEQSALLKSVEMGKILHKLHDSSKHGDWTARLADIGIAQQRASEDMRIALLAPAQLSRCLSKRAALLLAAGEKDSSKLPAAGGLQTQDSQAVTTSEDFLGGNSNSQESSVLTDGVTPCRECRLQGRTTPNPNCKTCKSRNAPQTNGKPKGGSTGRTGPGDDYEADGEPGTDPLVKRLDRNIKSFDKASADLIRMREVPLSDKEEHYRLSDEIKASVGKIAAMPPHIPKPPSPGKCKYCGLAILWTETAKAKKIPLDAQPRKGGKWDIIDNVATMIETNGQPAYLSHFMTCLKRPKKK